LRKTVVEGHVNDGIEVEVVWMDQDMLEWQFRCSNACFSGQAEIYLKHDKLSEVAESLSGFPSHTKDSREFELGTFNPDYAHGGIRMNFYCTDSVGHAAVEVKLRGDACKGLGELESVALCIPVQAAAIDSFVSQIRLMNREVGATAYLQMAK
jgi:hypothetical protein